MPLFAPVFVIYAVVSIFVFNFRKLLKYPKFCKESLWSLNLVPHDQRLYLTSLTIFIVFVNILLMQRVLVDYCLIFSFFKFCKPVVARFLFD